MMEFSSRKSIVVHNNEYSISIYKKSSSAKLDLDFRIILRNHLPITDNGKGLGPTSPRSFIDTILSVDKIVFAINMPCRHCRCSQVCGVTYIFLWNVSVKWTCDSECVRWGSVGMLFSSVPRDYAEHSNGWPSCYAAGALWVLHFIMIYRIRSIIYERLWTVAHCDRCYVTRV